MRPPGSVAQLTALVKLDELEQKQLQLVGSGTKTLAAKYTPV